MAIQKQEQLSPFKPGRGLVELGTQPIIGGLVVVLGHEQLAGLADEAVRLLLEVVVEANEIRIDVVEHIGVVIRVEKHGSRPDEGLQQHTPGRQTLGDLFDQGVFSPGPF